MEEATAEAVTDADGGGGDRVECAIGRRRRVRGGRPSKEQTRQAGEKRRGAEVGGLGRLVCGEEI